MDLCTHAYYKPEEKYFPYLYCRVDNKRCIYSKKCLKVEKFVPLENEMWRECPKFIMEKRNNLPKDSYFVQTYRPNNQGKLFLYVVMEDERVEKILSDFIELKQDYVYLKEIAQNKYKVSLIPFQDDKEIIDEKIIMTDIETIPIKKNVNKNRKKKQEI